MNRQLFRSTFCKSLFGCTRNKDHLYRKYATPNGSVAVVTGGSDGIGLAMCWYLASQGFNICIVSRDEVKMNARIKELKKKYPKLEMFCLVADFSKMKSVSDYREKISSKLENYDIAILAINAGVGYFGPFEKLTDEETERTVVVNGVQSVFLTKAIINQMISRFEETGKKPGIMITSSLNGARPTPGFTTHSACKSLISFLAEGLNYELQGRVDVLSFQAGHTCTRMLGDAKPDWKTASSEMAAECSFRDLGFESVTQGCFRHEFQHILAEYWWSKNQYMTGAYQVGEMLYDMKIKKK